MTKEELLKAKSIIERGFTIVWEIEKDNNNLAVMKERGSTLYVSGANIPAIEIPYDTTAGEVIIMAVEAHIRELEKELETLKLEEA